MMLQFFNPVPMAADTTLVRDMKGMGGFVAKTAGTLTVLYTNGITLLDAIPVAAGQVLSLPLSFGRNDQLSMTVTLGGGASGTFLAA